MNQELIKEREALGIVANLFKEFKIGSLLNISNVNQIKGASPPEIFSIVSLYGILLRACHADVTNPPFRFRTSAFGHPVRDICRFAYPTALPFALGKNFRHGRPKPKAPSPTKSSGDACNPRLWRSGSSSRQDCLLSRYPPSTAIDSFLPSGVAPSQLNTPRL